MYKVFCDDTLICDSRVEDLALINPIVKKEENKAGSFSFTLPTNHALYGLIKRKNSEITVYRGSKLIFAGECISEKINFYKQKEITCAGELSYLKRSVLRTGSYSGTLASVLQQILLQHNLQVEEKRRFILGDVTITTGEMLVDTSMNTTWDVIERLAEDHEAVIKVRHTVEGKVLDFLSRDELISNQVIEFGGNMLDLISNIDSAEVVTAVIPLGKEIETEDVEKHLTIKSVNDGIDYLSNNDTDFGWICKAIYAEEIDDPQKLKEYGEKYLSDYQFETMYIEAKAVDLGISDTALNQFDVSENVRVISKAHGIDRLIRLTSLDSKLNDPGGDVITLGKKEKYSIAGRARSMESKMRQKIGSDYIISAINNSPAGEKIDLSKLGGIDLKNVEWVMIEGRYVLCKKQ